MNDVGGHIGMILLLFFIFLQYSFQIMRSLCQEQIAVILDSSLNDFGSPVGMILLLLSITICGKFQIMRSLCQEEREADVSISLRSQWQNEFQIMRSLCPEECEAYVEILRSRAKICLIRNKGTWVWGSLGQNLLSFYF